MTNYNVHIQGYMDIVREKKIPVCEEQLQLIDLVEHVFETEDIYVDSEQLEEYLSYQKYFPFKLFPWEKFVFALHNCTYTAEGFPRFPYLLIYVGRGAGKNGYLGFENFCLLTETNRVKKYNIYIYAMSESQAKMSWQDVYDVLENNKIKMEKHFKWTKEVIINKKTKSEFWYKANNTKTMDSFRPGKIDHDEAHGYESAKNVTTPVTGLGKVAHPRRTITSTDGNVRGGYLDEMLEKSRQILRGEKADNGLLPFLCRLDNDDEIHQPEMWHKANPSLQYLPTLMRTLQSEYVDFVDNPILNADFATKRMNRPTQETEGCVAEWEQIIACNQEIDESAIYGRPCVAAIDYMKTNDFLGAGLLYKVDGKSIWVTHTWVCRRSSDLKRIKAPLDVWEKMGLLTFVEAPEIPPEIPAVWVVNEAVKRGSIILKFAIDYYRYTLLKKALNQVNITSDKDGIVKLIRPSDEMLIVPTVTSCFANALFVWGDNPLMCWAANNSKLVTSPAGNITYGKIEPKSRKTDPFKALVMAECVSDVLDENFELLNDMQFDVMIFD